MTTFLRKNYELIIVLAICFLIIILNFDFSKLVIGLDNASPYFDISDVLGRIRGTSSIIYGGILFQAPFIYILKVLQFTPEVISNLYISINFILGSIGILLLTKRITKDRIAAILSTVILITSLFTIWIISNPNFLFIASYGTIPLLIYLLSKEKLKLKHYVLISVLSILFLTTTLNIVAFLLFASQIVLIAFVLSKKTSSIKRLLIWITTVILFWIISIQCTMLINGDSSLFVIQIFNYIGDLIKHPYMSVISSGIIASEKTNSILNVANFSTGWMELHDSGNAPVFEYYGIYKENIFYTLLGIAPFALSLLALGLEKTKKVIGLTALLLLFLFLSSRFGVSVIENIPFVREALRWPSSKLWPIYILPLTVLSGISISYITKLRKFVPYVMLSTLVVILLFYSFPVLSGNLISSKTKVNIPQEYFNIPRDSKILILPNPQRLYMREYEWGYYGSDFISYINNSEIVDGANLYEYAPLYEEIFQSGVIPGDIEYILYDTSAEVNQDDSTIQESRALLEGLRKISYNEYFEIYER